MGNRFSFETDSDLVKLVLRLDSSHSEAIIAAVSSLPILKSKYSIANGDILFFFQDSFDEFLQRDTQEYKRIKEEVYAIDRVGQPESGTVTLNVSGFRTGVHHEQLMDYIRKIFEGETIQIQTRRIAQSLILGLDYFMQLSKPFYHFKSPLPISNLDKFSEDADFSKVYIEPSKKGFPFIFIKIRGGVSFYKITSPGNFQRLAGSIMGESFVEGIMLKLTKYKNINEGFTDGFKKGDNKACDMTVEDIYGSGCTNLGIPKDILASSFGKCSRNGSADSYKQADIMKSLLISMTVNLGQLIGLYSKLENIPNILVSSWKIQSEEFNFSLQSTLAYYSSESKIDFIEDSDFLSCVGDQL